MYCGVEQRKEIQANDTKNIFNKNIFNKSTEENVHKLRKKMPIKVQERDTQDTK